METSAEGMLSPYRILDLTDMKGQLCGKLLGDMGADVIKIEPPGGDAARNLGPFYHDNPHPERSLNWLAFNTSKRDITLDISTRDGQALFMKLVEKADAVVESFDPGYLGGLGLGYAALTKINPKIILTSITPFGQTGPYSSYKGEDLVCWALSGKMLITGDADRAPVRVSHLPHAWYHGSVDGAAGTAMAIFWRGTSGRGQHVDVSMQESMEKVGIHSHVAWTLLHRHAARGPFLRTPPSNTSTNFIWQCKDGYIVFYPFSGLAGFFASKPVVDLMDAEGLADDFIRNLDWMSLDWGLTTQEDADRIQGYFSRYFLTKTKAELFKIAREKSQLIQPVNTAGDIMEHPQLKGRDYWQQVDHPDIGETLVYPGPFLKASETTCGIRRRAPHIGEHNMEIYHRELGLSIEEIAALKGAGTI
jgi:crotonobetainyl-CoA:carnitine CoA-transferase CaiB-like acyl-CoA transferase